MENWGVKVMSIGFLVEPMQAIIWRGPMASGAVKQFLSDVDWGDLDYLLFDLPPGTGDIQLTLVQTIPLTGAVVVTTPQDISLADARKAYAMFGKVGVPILGLVENMSYYVCPHCGERSAVFLAGGGGRLAAELGIPLLGQVPLQAGMPNLADTGSPIVVAEPASPAAMALTEIARRVAAQLAGGPGPALPTPSR